MHEKPVLNVSAYRFLALSDLPVLRQRLYESAAHHALKGTVLLAHEGINLFLAGEPQALRSFMSSLNALPPFANLTPAIEGKYSGSKRVPFRRLCVKIKPEIIRMNHPAIAPAQGRAPAVDATTLARWLDVGHDDNGRPVVMLDTRNAFEAAHGRFEHAIDWRLSRFGQFPQAVLDHGATLAGKTVVSYCTGGIRCEKAALFMQAAGFEHVLQLDGGILAYFEQTDGRHFQGDCFVFDQRESVDISLAEKSFNHF
jgi:UPF0176 protein